MIAIGIANDDPFTLAAVGEKIVNGDGTISLKNEHGFLSIDSGKTVKYAPTGDGPDEHFHDGGSCIVVINNFAKKAWILPKAEFK